MRRQDREIKDIKNICDIIDQCKVFRVATSVDDIPYIIPLNFGYTYNKEIFEFYFHCANEGKKLEMFKKNNRICFEMDLNHKLTVSETACGYGYNYTSIIGTGYVELVADLDDKIKILSHLMKHQTAKDFTFTKEQASAVTVCKINVLEISAKERML